MGHALRSHGRTALGPTGGTEIEVVAHEAFETQALHEATATIASVEDTSKAFKSYKFKDLKKIGEGYLGYPRSVSAKYRV